MWDSPISKPISKTDVLTTRAGAFGSWMRRRCAHLPSNADAPSSSPGSRNVAAIAYSLLPPGVMMTKLHLHQTRCQACPLKNHKIFRDVSDAEISFIEHFKTGEFVTDAGATILAEGSNGAHLFTVLSGWAFRYKLLPDGRRQILSFVLPGEFLGLQSSMTAEMYHSVEALTPMVLCVFPKNRLWTLYEKHPRLAFDLTWLASRSERSLDENLLSLGRRSATEKVAFALLDVFERARQVGMTSGNRLKLPFTQQHLSDALGLSLVHTNKTLKALTARRLFRWKNGEFELLDEARMHDAASSEPSDATLRPLI